MRYDMQPASAADDAAAWAACVQQAHSNSDFERLMWPKELIDKIPAEEIRAQRADRIRKRLSEPQGLFNKIIDADQPEIVLGFSAWFKPGHFGEKAKSTSEEQQSPVDPSVPHAVAPDGLIPAEEPPPIWVNADLFKEFNRKMVASRNDIWGEDSNYWYLGSLGVHPNHQHKGLAKRMMRIGVDYADHDKLPIYLEATPAGAPFYEQYGFVKQGKFTIAEGQYTVTLMVRPPCGALPAQPMT